MPIHGSDANFLGMHLANLYRLKKAGYPDSRLSGLTTVEGLIADIRTFAGLRNPNAAERFEAGIDALRWMKSNGPSQLAPKAKRKCLQCATAQ